MNKNIKDIYSLTPLQEGMLYHWLADKQSTAYFEQVEFKLEGTIDMDILEESFNAVIRRYDVLRTIFIYEKVRDPVQVVLKERELKVQFLDISGKKGDRESIIKEFKEKDRAKGFNLSKDLLTRIALFKTAEAQYRLVWSSHHILMDGWCLGILFNDFAQVYGALRKGQSLKMESVFPYSRYIRWLEKQDRDEGLKYWKQYLAGIEESTLLPGYGAARRISRYRQEEYELEIDTPLTSGIDRMARETRVTPNTIFQVFWGLLLQRYNNSRDVVFGVVVSGRPPELEGVEQMVGLFANTIPVRIKTGDSIDFAQLLHQVYRDTSLSKSYEYLPLPEIQSNSPLKSRLVDHLFAFENFPLETVVNDTDQGVGFELTL